jgi:hypothetical protein
LNISTADAIRTSGDDAVGEDPTEGEVVSSFGRARMIVRTFGGADTYMWELCRERGEELRTVAAGMSEVVLRVLIAREASRSPGLVIVDRRSSTRVTSPHR